MLPDGTPQLKRSAGGLVSALLPLTRSGKVNWVFPISTPAEIEAHKHDLYGQEMENLFPIPVSADVHDAAYNRIANELLWYLNHGMFSLSRGPTFDTAFFANWKLFMNYSLEISVFLETHAPHGSNILLQDYHMFLVPGTLSKARPDLKISLFLHTPFATAGEFSILPDTVAKQLLESLSALEHFGFHCNYWRNNYLGVVNANNTVGARNTWVNPLGSDLPELTTALSEPAVALEVEHIRSLANGRMIIARVDRMEPSKNILRGIDAVVELFKFYPSMLGKVVHLANCYPSREDVPDYMDYALEVTKKASWANNYLRQLARNIGVELLLDPIEISSQDNFNLSLAVLCSYDVLLVNPIRDGFNLVANEGPLINKRHGSLVLSKNAGIAEVIGDAALLVNPFDVRETALAIHQGLEKDTMTKEADQVRLLQRLAVKNPSLWFEEQMNWFSPS